MRQGDTMDHGSGDTRARLRQGLSIWALALAATFVACAAFIAPAAQAERVLDAELSLIGGCSGKVEALDPVEDPGCPTTTPPASGHPPAGIFADPRGVTTDFYGNIYVSSFGKLENGSQGRVDVFDPDGVFITELKTTGPKSLAVDSKGNLYVIAEVESARRLFRFAPTGTYEPGAGKIEYGSVPVALSQPEASSASLHSGIAVNVANDHVFANYGGEGLIEYDSAEAGNVILRRIAMPTYPYGVGIAVDAERGRLYATANGLRIDIFDLNEVVGSPPNEEYKKVGTIEGSAVPAGEFGGFLSVAVDEGTGHVFVLDGESNVVFEFESTGTYLATIEHGFISSPGAVIGVDNGPFSPHGALSTTGRYLYVPSGKTGTGHSFAFEESNSRAPVVKSVSTAGLTENEVEFLAAINPGNLETTYTFEYTTQESFEEEGFGAATIAGSGKLPAGNLDDEASAVAGGLLPETQYRFRVVASNEKEPSAEMQGTFSTYPATPTEPTACENQTLRTGRSALLPDCRAYELVTPADTNARAPLGVGHEGGWFTTHQVSPGGDKVPFRVEGGSLPGIGGTGSYLGDPYLSSRSANGWNTAYIGPTGEEAVTVMPGGNSPDKGYSFFNAEGAGSAAFPGRSTTYLRYPDGHTELLGKGSVGTDPEVLGMLISEGAQHVIFGTGAGASETTAIQLEPDAPPSGTRAIYDRSPDRTLHVISLKPGNIPLAADELAVFTGASLDGEGVAFEVNNKTLYLRYQDSETFEIGEGVTFAGVAEGGNYLFYLEGGRLWRFDAVTEDRTPFSSSPVVPVNVSADGSAAYFISTSKLSSEPNPNGAFAKAGKQNLYLSREGAISFVGTITERDVVGRVGTSERVDGLGLWADAVGKPTPGTLASDPSRTTPNGGVIVFQSRAPLAGYDPEGHAQIYRYDSVGNELQCLSCNPTGGPAIADASFQSEQREGFVLFYNQAWLENLRPDGRRAIFQSMEALVPGDTDGLQDIYEWEDKGVGSCTRSGGCLYLISSGHSLRNDYLYAVSESGNDVFVLSSDLLLPADLDETPSIYDARVGGGFPETGSVECQGEGCRPGLSPAPALPDAQTPVQGPGENFKSRPCGKGKHKVKRHGQTRCVKKKHKKQRRSRAGSDKKGARK
jgi:hypothetical protein